MAINLSELKNKAANSRNLNQNMGMKANQSVNLNERFNNPNLNNNINLDKPFIQPGQDIAQKDVIEDDKIMIDPDLLSRSQQINDVPLANEHIGHDFVTNTNPYAKVEEKVAHLSLQVNQVIIRPYLQQALEYLKNSKLDAINAYNQLSDEIANEVKIISQNTNVISNNLKQAKDVIARTQDVIRNRYNNATEEEIANSSLNLDYEYNIVAEHYELSLQLSQELSKYKSRIDTLLSSQTLLDESIIPSISRIQLEIENLELLLHSLDSTDYASIIAKKTGRKIPNLNYNQQPMVGRGKALNNLVEQTGVYNYNNLNNTATPNLSAMNRYEDPYNASLTLNKTPANQAATSNNEYLRKIDEENKKIAEAQSRIDALKGILNSPEQMNQMNNSSNNMNQMNNMYNPYASSIPMTRKEMRLQRKLQRQQMKLNAMNMYDPQRSSFNNGQYGDDFKMQSMQQQYSDNLAAMQKIQASNINIQNDLVQMQQERQLRLQEQMQQQFVNMMQQQQMQQQMVQQFYQQMQQPILNVGMNMTNPINMTYPVYQTVNTGLNTMPKNIQTNNLGSNVVEKRIPIDTLEENLAKSPRDKIFVVRNAEPINVNGGDQRMNNMKNLRTIKVIR